MLNSSSNYVYLKSIPLAVLLHVHHSRSMAVLCIEFFCQTFWVPTLHLLDTMCFFVNLSPLVLVLKTQVNQFSQSVSPSVSDITGSIRILVRSPCLHLAPQGRGFTFTPNPARQRSIICLTGLAAILHSQESGSDSLPPVEE